jgi:hypothetical protein
MRWSKLLARAQCRMHAKQAAKRETERCKEDLDAFETQRLEQRSFCHWILKLIPAHGQESRELQGMKEVEKQR